MFTVKALTNLNRTSKLARVTLRKNSVWTEDRVIKSPYRNIEIPNCTLYDYVWQNLDKWPEKHAAVCAVTGRAYTYEEVFKLSNTFAANLRAKFKIREGDTVAVILSNIPEYPIVTLGILRAGCTVTSFLPNSTAREVQRQLTMSETKLIVTLPKTVPVIKEALKAGKLSMPIVVVKTSGDPTPKGTALFHELSKDIHADKSCLKEVERNNNDICLRLYSSGTTGLPKVVDLTHRNIIANSEQNNEPLIRYHNDTTATHQDSFICNRSLTYIYGTSVLLFHKLSIGGKIVMVDKDIHNIEAFLCALQEQKTNIVMITPSLVCQLGSHPMVTEKTFEHVDVLVYGGASLAACDLERFCHKVKKNIDIRQSYGMTEASPVVALSPKRLNRTIEQTGPPIPNTELRIVDKDIKNLGPNESGEILVRGPQVMRGYKDNPEANKEAFTADGWFRTGDVGVADEQGVLTCTARLKEMIKVQGCPVSPTEMESLFLEHPSVIEAAVVGIPHPTEGENAKAFVVLKPGHKCTEGELANFVNEKLVVYKHIRDISLINELPKNAGGKTVRRILKERYC